MRRAPAQERGQESLPPRDGQWHCSGARPRTDARAGGPAAKDGPWHRPASL